MRPAANDYEITAAAGSSHLTAESTPRAVAKRYPIELRKPNAEQLRSLETEGVCSRHLHRKPCRACRGGGRR